MCSAWSIIIFVKYDWFRIKNSMWGIYPDVYNDKIKISRDFIYFVYT